MHAALERFSPATREWFSGAFPEPTAAQVGAWEAISAGGHALVVAPQALLLLQVKQVTRLLLQMKQVT